MNVTIILIIFRWLPALLMLAADDSKLSGHITSENLSCLWKHVRTNRKLKVFVWNQTVLVKIKWVEALFKLFFRNVIHAPEFEVKLQVFSADFASSLDVEILESFFYRFPLEANFFDNFLLKVMCVEDFCSLPFVIIFQLNFLFFQLQLIFRVTASILSKVETWRHMKCIPKPFWKVSVIYSSLLLLVFVSYQFF